jgi:hypothetical protein
VKIERVRKFAVAIAALVLHEVQNEGLGALGISNLLFECRFYPVLCDLADPGISFGIGRDSALPWLAGQTLLPELAVDLQNPPN